VVWIHGSVRTRYLPDQGSDQLEFLAVEHQHQSCWYAGKYGGIIYLANQHLKGGLERCGRYPHEDDRPCWSDVVACLDIWRSLRNRISISANGAPVTKYRPILSGECNPWARMALETLTTPAATRAAWGPSPSAAVTTSGTSASPLSLKSIHFSAPRARQSLRFSSPLSIDERKRGQPSDGDDDVCSVRTWLPMAMTRRPIATAYWIAIRTGVSREQE
jgi:hypothetical protein